VPAPARRPAAELTALPGVGARTAEKLANRGLASLEDLVFLLPLEYVDLRRRDSLVSCEEGARAVIEGTVRDFRQGWFNGRYNAKLRIEQSDPDGALTAMEARWFHPFGGLGQRVGTGERVVLGGVIKLFRGQLSMVHPEILDPEGGDTGISVRYPVVEGVGARTVRKLCAAALDLFFDGELRDVLPPDLVAEHDLPPLEEALRSLHAPEDELDEGSLEALQSRSSRHHRRLAFEEHFFLQLALLDQRTRWRAQACVLDSLAADSFDREQLRACLPFEPTQAQWRVLRDIEEDMAGGAPMLRLLQGDVGSGKTVVAFASAVAVVRGGGQAAVMAPTEILAEQHFRSLSPWCERAGVRLALLTGSTGRAQRKTLLSLLGAGEIDLLVGTHALLVDDVHFERLGLVVVDEQHRFGVEQRAALRDKGRAPHLLVMTATPIPRSLALTAFGELDVSVIDELPPGRQPPKTRLFTGKTSLEAARRRLVSLVTSGGRAFVVCPLVEASEAVAASDVEATAEALRMLIPDRRVGVVHGRMVSRDKDAIMRSFRDGELDVLVATTVIEVGVDIPDASVILVEHAERFGLAQLHQLRGRVGRSEGASHCLLHTASSKGSDAGKRLGVMAESSDGFEIAERDLEIRGPGEVFGTQQSGVPRLRFSSFTGKGLEMLNAARDAARRLLSEDPGLTKHPKLRDELSRRTAALALFAGESG
jgi:ATP-dependent DNA helicase RecG